MTAESINRRKFIKTTGIAAAAISIVPNLVYSFDPKRLQTVTLGKTGVKIPRMIIGTGSRFMATPEDKGLKILEHALDNGFYYWDTAANYRNNEQYSEERLGKILKDRRKEVFLSTKVEERDSEGAKRTVETSLKRLNTDYIDLYQIHSVTNEEEVRRFGEGVYKVLKDYQSQGVIRYIGFTGHTSAKAMKLAAELYDFDTMLIALNHQKKEEAFEELPIPYAAKKGMGVLAMKVIRPRETVSALDPKDLVRYALSLDGVTAAVIGTDNIDVLNTNMAVVKDFKPLTKERMQSLHVELEPFYQSPYLPWMQPGYHDGLLLA
jgi:aryl-alcohol dehydrogenase-like predicted oxidoreductase